MQFEAPLEGGGENQAKRYEVDEAKVAVRSAARAIVHYSATMPPERLTEQYQALKDHLHKDEVYRPQLPASLVPVRRSSRTSSVSLSLSLPPRPCKAEYNAQSGATQRCL